MSSAPPRLPQLLLPLTFVFIVAFVGTVGYFLLWWREGGTFLDALYMTVITMTTIGYGEIRHLDSVGRVFTMFIAITGVSSLFYSFGVVMDYWVSTRILDPHGKLRMEDEIRHLENHIIVCGMGRVGRQAALELQEAHTEFVALDSEPASQDYAEAKGYRFILGDATEDELLEKAGIAKASGLIVTTGSDASNLYIVLSARALNPKLFIVSRAIDESGVAKLMRAGANRAISPYAIGGRRLAHLMLSPTVVDFFETILGKGEQSLNIEDVEVIPGAPAVGQRLGNLQLRERSGSSVLVVLRGGQAYANPESSWVLHAGDKLLCLGTNEQLTKLVDIISGTTGPETLSKLVDIIPGSAGYEAQ